MVRIPPNDILTIGLCIGLIGGFILSKNYFKMTASHVILEGRLQLGGNSFDMKNRIIDRYHALIGFPLFATSIIINIIYIIFLQKHTTFERSLFFGSSLTTLTTIAILFLVLITAMFSINSFSKREYLPLLLNRERDNFNHALTSWNQISKDTGEIKELEKEIDQLLSLFDIKLQANIGYDRKLKILKEKVFK